MNHVLIISGDTVDSQMGGVGVRNWEIAQALSRHFRVTLAVPNDTDLAAGNVNLVRYELENGDLRPFVQDVDVVVAHGFVLHFHPYLRTLGIPLAIDLYVPYLLESLVWHANEDWQGWIPAYEEYVRVQSESIRAGDFFFCASERQRDYWLGWLNALKRINPHTYRQDASLRSLIDVVAFGLPSTPPRASQLVLKGVHPGIDASDRVILWSGGLWDWLDPLTLLRAVAQVSLECPQLKLFFMGTQHPNPVVTGMSMPERAIDLSKALGLYGSQVFFGDWVPYQERGAYLLESDFAVVSHPGHIETHFSFRTRVLDSIWAGLPLIITEGDAMAEWVISWQLGFTVPPNDVEALSVAIKKMLSTEKETFAPRFETLRQALRWEKVIKPLAQFCLQPAQAPDKGHYLTDAERIGRDKDAFLEQVIRDKDAFLEQVIRDKDAHAAGLEAQLDRYRRLLPLRAYAWLRRRLNG